jgi:hypothetical protein
MPIKLKGGPRDGEEVPDTLAGNEFTSTTRPPTPSSRPPRRDQGRGHADLQAHHEEHR